MEPSSACSYVATQRGGVALLFEGHRYNKVRDGKDGTVYWRCSRDRQCPGRAVTVNNRVKKSNNKHNHPPEASLMLRNGGGHGHGHNHHHHQQQQHHHSNTTQSSTNASATPPAPPTPTSSSSMAAAAAAAAAYSSLLNNNKSSHNSNNNSMSKSSSTPPVGACQSQQLPQQQPQRIPPLSMIGNVQSPPQQQQQPQSALLSLPPHHQHHQFNHLNHRFDHQPQSSPQSTSSASPPPPIPSINDHNSLLSPQNFQSALTFLQSLASSTTQANNSTSFNHSHNSLNNFLFRQSLNESLNNQVINLSSSSTSTSSADNNNDHHRSNQSIFEQSIKSLKQSAAAATTTPPLSPLFHQNQLRFSPNFTPNNSNNNSNNKSNQYNKLLLPHHRNHKYSSSQRTNLDIYTGSGGHVGGNSTGKNCNNHRSNHMINNNNGGNNRPSSTTSPLANMFSHSHHQQPQHLNQSSLSPSLQPQQSQQQQQFDHCNQLMMMMMMDNHLNNSNSNNTSNNSNLLNDTMFQDVATFAAIAAAATNSFPSLLGETFKFLSPPPPPPPTISQSSSSSTNQLSNQLSNQSMTPPSPTTMHPHSHLHNHQNQTQQQQSSTNSQMAAAAAAAAALAQTLYSQNLLKNFDLSMVQQAAQAAAAVVAATTTTNNSNNSLNICNDMVDDDDCVDDDDDEGDSNDDVDDDIIDDDNDPNIRDNNNHHRNNNRQSNHNNHSTFVSLGTNLQRSDLVINHSNNFYNSSNNNPQQDQPFNMVLKDKTNLLKILRNLMRAAAGSSLQGQGSKPATMTYHALIVPTSDAHNSEYIAPCDARREFITNFTGSYGTAVITLDEAALWTDGRYFLQAERELNLDQWRLMKQYQPDTPTIGEWLNRKLPKGSTIGVDGNQLSHEQWLRLEQELSASGNSLVETDGNLIDQIWLDRPPRSTDPIWPLSRKFTGKSWPRKLQELRQKMLAKDSNCKMLILSSLDDIAWLFNLRGSDIEYNPVFFAYAIITLDRAYLFVNEAKLATKTLKHLGIIRGDDAEAEAEEDDYDDQIDHDCDSKMDAKDSAAAAASTDDPPDEQSMRSPATSISSKSSSAESASATTTPIQSMIMSKVIEIKPYESIKQFLRSYIANELSEVNNDKIWISQKTSYSLVNIVPKSMRLLTPVTPVCLMKTIKNNVELNGMRWAHIKDAVAICELFAWIEDELDGSNSNDAEDGKDGEPMVEDTTEGDDGATSKRKKMTEDNDTEMFSPSSTATTATSNSDDGTSSTSTTTTTATATIATGKMVVDELNVDTKLDEFRRKQKDYVGPSFATIAGFGPNSSIIHYRSTPETNRRITKNEIFLLDCGGQYLDGTTDITRTVHFGQPTPYEKECFTRVLKGHIQFARLKFPRLVKGQFLDSFARQSLWSIGLDYNHGTGHGVGMCLNVHEPPILVTNRLNPDDPGMDEAMILSNEPGYYESNRFGIRIENLVVTKIENLKHNFNDRGYLGFETITMVPIQTKLIDLNLLTIDEIQWINDYHQQCRQLVGKELKAQGMTKALQWLLKETEPINQQCD